MTSKKTIDQMIRVNQAGEFGAVRIYKGQLDFLKDKSDDSYHEVQHMAEQEKKHLDTFNKIMTERHVRPTVFSPLWHVAGYAMGAITASMGKEAAMACTEAVEDVIDEHYAKQLDSLGNEEKELKDVIAQFREEEIEHRDKSIDHGAHDAPAYHALRFGVKTASKLAIFLSERF